MHVIMVGVIGFLTTFWRYAIMSLSNCTKTSDPEDEGVPRCFINILVSRFFYLLL